MSPSPTSRRPSSLTAPLVLSCLAAWTFGCGDARSSDALDTPTDIEAPDTRDDDTSTDIEIPDAADADDTSTDIEVPDALDADTSTTDTDTTPPAALPPWLSYCDPDCDAREPAVLAVCPEAAPTCLPTTTATLIPSVDGHRVSAIAFLASLPDGYTLRVVSGPASLGGPIVTAYAPRVELRSDRALSVTYYDLAVAPGATLALDFTSTTQTSEVLDSVFYRHPAWDTGTAATDLHTMGQATIRAERDATGVTSEKIHAYFMPTELAAIQGEGNFSFGDGRVTSNYGNPPYAAAIGGIVPVAFPRFAHECAHELFDQIRAAYPGNATCLNEGVADALAFAVGSLPEGDFGPIGLRGDDFDDPDRGCADLTEIHDVGNCYFWHMYRAGFLGRQFMRSIFQPGRVLDFDSCDPRSTHTGDTLLVLFTEAATSDTTPGRPDPDEVLAAVDAMRLTHSGSYAAALSALGLTPR